MLAEATPGEDAEELLPPHAAATMATMASTAIGATFQEAERGAPAEDKTLVLTVKTPLVGLLPR